MSQINTAFAKRLVPGEDLIAMVEDLFFAFEFVTHATPDRNLAPKLNGAMALTTHRLIIGWAETQQGLKWLHVPALNSVSERPLRADKPNWQYQAILYVPGGLAVVVQTQEASEQHGAQLSNFLNQAIVRLGGAFHDDSLASIIHHQEDVERERREAEDKRRQAGIRSSHP